MKCLFYHLLRERQENSFFLHILLPLFDQDKFQKFPDLRVECLSWSEAQITVNSAAQGIRLGHHLLECTFVVGAVIVDGQSKRPRTLYDAAESRVANGIRVGGDALRDRVESRQGTDSRAFGDAVFVFTVFQYPLLDKIGNTIRPTQGPKMNRFVGPFTFRPHITPS